MAKTRVIPSPRVLGYVVVTLVVALWLFRTRDL
jgi:hypothetical protein